MICNFEVEGLDTLLRKLENIGKEGSIIENNSLKEAVEPILEDEKSTTLFEDRTGKLRNSLKISKVKKSKYGKSVWIGDIDKKANYSWYVQFGSTKSKPHKARPFITQAFERNKDTVYQNLKNSIEKNLKKNN